MEITPCKSELWESLSPLLKHYRESEGVSELLIWYPLTEDEYYQLCEGEP
jgi:hypothetical protein